VAQVANAARNYEILYERDDDDAERPDKRQKSGDRHQPTTQQSSHRNHSHNNDRHGSDRRGGGDNHRSNNNSYSGNNNRLNFKSIRSSSTHKHDPKYHCMITGVPVIGVTREAEVSSPTDLSILFFPQAEQERLKMEYHSIRQTDTETSTEFMQRFLRLAGFLGAAAGTAEEQAKNFQWGFRKSTLNHLMCIPFTDVAQVAKAARNYEILHKRDDDGAKRPDKRQKSGDRHQPTTQQSSHRNHGHNNDRHGSDRRGGGDNHRSNNNYSGNNNRSSGNGRDQRNRGQQSNRPVNSGNSS
nr:zinc finger, CCHC-type, retrotransposon Gag domain protein [Tanacetum cinerariifolium]